MTQQRTANLRNSIAGKLLFTVFSIYFIVAVTLTISHMLAEYYQAKDKILVNLEMFLKTFEKGLAVAYWDADVDQIQTILEGVVEIPFVVGIYIEDRTGNKLGALGKIVNRKGEYVISGENEELAPLEAGESDFFGHQFSLIYTGEGKKIVLGKGKIYSSSKIVFQQVKNGFIIIIINAILKTLALWLIFLFISRRVLNRPLSILTSAALQTDFNDQEYQIIDVKTSGRNELKILEEAFNTMRNKIVEDRETLKRINFNLESLVNERTLELTRAKNEAEIANKAKSEFLANMSHELRTPLNAVTGFSELLTSIVTDKKQKSYLNSIKTAGRSLLTLINDILDLSKIEAGKIELERSSVSLKSIFEEIEQIFTMKLAEKNIDFIVSLDQDLPGKLFLDETRVRQILLNLVGNAIKFTEDGHIKLSATISSLQEKQVDLMISVEDTGIGIAEEDQTRIFDVFTQQTGQHLKKYGGTGLGLTITKRLTGLMNGQIKVESSKGVGSTFKIILKSVGISSMEVAAIENEENNINDIQFDKASVLVVDDIKSNRDLLCELLKKLNLECTTAEDGQTAVMLAEEIKPDLVIMDIRMPVMDGYQANQKLKENPKTVDIPVIALTASVMHTDKLQAAESGFESFLTKPIKIKKFLKVLSKYLTYTTKNKEERREVILSMDLVDCIIEQPAKLIIELENEILPLFQIQKRAMVMEDIGEFAEKLQDMGEAHNVQALISYAAELYNDLKLFDVLAIQKKFQTFQSEIEALISELEKSND